MKKQYMKPQVETVKLESHNLLAGSPPGWSGEGGAPEYNNDMQEMQDLLFGK